MTPKPWENGEGYPDPTAYNALRPIMQEDAALEGKVNFLIKVLKFIIGNCPRGSAPGYAQAAHQVQICSP